MPISLLRICIPGCHSWRDLTLGVLPLEEEEESQGPALHENLVARWKGGISHTLSVPRSLSLVARALLAFPVSL